MASTIQTIVAPVTLKSFRTLLNEPARFKSSEPMGVINFAQSGVAITAIGIGDTAQVRILFNLPRGFLYVFRDLVVVIQGNGSDATEWQEGSFSAFFGIPNQTNPIVKLEYPMLPAQLRVQATGNDDSVVYNFGGISPSPLATEQFLVPTLTPKFPMSSGAATSMPLFQMVNRQDGGPWTADFLCRFSVFPIEQGDNSGMYWTTPPSDS